MKKDTGILSFKKYDFTYVLAVFFLFFCRTEKFLGGEFFFS